MLDTQTGELVERRLEHENGEARAFYTARPGAVRIGMEAAQTASRRDPELRRDYLRLKFCRGSAVAKVVIARKLAVRLYWKLREAGQPSAAGSHAG